MMAVDAIPVAFNSAPGPFWHEYLRPCKLGTYSIGLSLLIVGSFCYRAPDWDIPVSIIMSLFTYLTAGWSLLYSGPRFQDSDLSCTLS